MKKVVRHDWKIHGGSMRKEFWIMVTPRVVKLGSISTAQS